MPPRLSVRQEQCVRLTAFRTDKEIAAHLGISEATVKKHVHEACRRLGVNRRKAALAILEHDGPGFASNLAVEGPPIESDRMAEATPDEDGVFAGSATVETGRDPAAVRRYSPPPRGPLFRLTMIALIAVVICALLIAVLWMVGEVHHVVGRLDQSS